MEGVALAPDLVNPPREVLDLWLTPMTARLPEPTLSVRLLWPFVRVLGPDNLAAAGTIGIGIDMPPTQFVDPDARLPHSAVISLLNEAVGQLGSGSFGLRAAAETEAGDIDVLEYAARTCSTLEEALLCTARYFRLMNEAAAVTLTSDGSAALLTYTNTDGLEDPPTAVDFVLAGLMRFIRRNAAVDDRQIEVSFTHAPPSYAADYREVFRGPIQFRATSNCIRLPRAYLELPMKMAEPALASAFHERAERLLEKLDESNGVSGSVRNLVTHHLASGHVTMAWTARNLGMSVSTLRRHLESEGSTFRDIVDAVRKDVAERQLRDGRVGISELAFVLGFSSVSAFHRAFKRWRGEAPTEYRDRMRRS